MKIEESEIWKELVKLDMITRERIIEQLQNQIESKFNCTINDRSYGELSKINNPALAVQCTIRNICYLKEFKPK